MGKEINNQALTQVKNEMVSNIKTVMSDFAQWLERPDSSGVSELFDRLSEISASLSFIGFQQAGKLTDTIIEGIDVLNKSSSVKTNSDNDNPSTGAEVASALLVLEDFINRIGSSDTLDFGYIQRSYEALENAKNKEIDLHDLDIMSTIEPATFDIIFANVAEVISENRQLIEAHENEQPDTQVVAQILENNNELINLFATLDMIEPQLLLYRVNDLIDGGSFSEQLTDIAEAMLLVESAFIAAQASQRLSKEDGTDLIEKQREFNRHLVIEKVLSDVGDQAIYYIEHFRKKIVIDGAINHDQDWRVASKHLAYYQSVTSLSGLEEFSHVLTQLGVAFSAIFLHKDAFPNTLFAPVVDALVGIEYLFTDIASTGQVNDNDLLFLRNASKAIETVLPVSGEAKALFSQLGQEVSSTDDLLVNSNLLDNLNKGLSALEGDYTPAEQFDDDELSKSKDDESKVPENDDDKTDSAESVISLQTNHSDSMAGSHVEGQDNAIRTITSQATSTEEDNLAQINVSHASLADDSDADDVTDSQIDSDASEGPDNTNISKAQSSAGEPQVALGGFFIGKTFADLNTLDVPNEKKTFLESHENALEDEEIRDFFIEEFEEILALIQSQLPDFKSNPHSLDYAKEIRRAFHTLKGSGRTVGYEALGEFAWQHEQLLNSVLDKHFPVNELVIDIVSEAYELLSLYATDRKFDQNLGALLQQALIAEKARLALLENEGANINDFVNELRFGVSPSKSSIAEAESPADLASSASSLTNDTATTTSIEDTVTAADTNTRTTESLELLDNEGESSADANADDFIDETSIKADVNALTTETTENESSEQEVGEEDLFSLAEEDFTNDDSPTSDEKAVQTSAKEDSVDDNGQAFTVVDEDEDSFKSVDSNVTLQAHTQQVEENYDLNSEHLEFSLDTEEESDSEEKSDHEDVAQQISSNNTVSRINQRDSADDSKASALSDTLYDESVETASGSHEVVAEEKLAISQDSTQTEVSEDTYRKIMTSLKQILKHQDDVPDDGSMLEALRYQMANYDLPEDDQSLSALKTQISQDLAHEGFTADNFVASVFDPELSEESYSSTPESATSDGLEERVEAIAKRLQKGMANSDHDSVSVQALSNLLLSQWQQQGLATDENSKQEILSELTNTLSKNHSVDDAFLSEIITELNHQITPHAGDYFDTSDSASLTSSVRVNTESGLVEKDSDKTSPALEMGHLSAEADETQTESSPTITTVGEQETNVDELTNLTEAQSTSSDATVVTLNETEPLADELSSQITSDDAVNEFSGEADQSKVAAANKQVDPVIPLVASGITKVDVTAEFDGQLDEQTPEEIATISGGAISGYSSSEPIDEGASEEELNRQQRLEAELSHLAEHPTLKDAGLSTSTDDEKSVQTQAVYIRAVDKLESISEVSLQKVDDISDLIEAVYDIEDSLEPEDTPVWMWRILDAMEQLLIALKDNELDVTENLVGALKESLEIIKNHDELDDDDVDQHISKLMQERANHSLNKPMASKEKPVSSLQEPTPIHEAMIDPNAASNLTETFIDEALRLFSKSHEDAEYWAEDLHQFSRLDGIRRNMHTLKGSALMANYLAISDLAHIVESLIEKVVEGQVPASSRAASLLIGAMWQGLLMLDDIQDGFLPKQDPYLLNNISSFLDEPLPYPEVEAALVEEKQQQALEAELAEAKQKEDALEQSSVAQSQVSSLQEDTEEQAGDFAFSDEVDPVLVEIFTDEALELIENTYSQINDDLKNTSHVDELKRALHTLKGGARLVGVFSMGDTAHNMESIADKLHTYPDSKLRQAKTLLQLGTDALFEMLDTLSRRQLPLPVQALDDALSLFAETGQYQLPSKEELQITTSDDSELDESTQGDQSVSKAKAIQSSEHLVEDIVEEGITEVSDATPAESAQLSTAQPNTLADGVPSVKEDALEDLAQQADLEHTQESPSNAAADTTEASSKASVDPQQSSTQSEPSPKVSNLPHFVRVEANLLDELISMTGEMAILRSRLENLSRGTEYTITELARVAVRIDEQTRRLDSETESHMLYSHKQYGGHSTEFDPLELDRFSEMQQLSRQLAEAVDDLKSLNDSLQADNSLIRTITLQQSVLQRNIQNNLMSTQMMRFDVNEPRLKRLIKQTISSIDREVEFVLTGGDVELERRLLEELLPALEHILRNALYHGIEPPAERKQVGKPEKGVVKVDVSLSAAELILRIVDDGRGFDYERIRQKAIEKDMLDEARQNDHQYLSSLIFKSGFSTADKLSKLSGRGVGMDVVNEIVKQRRGRVSAQSIPGKGSEFIITVPFSMSISEVLLVEIAGQVYAAPMSSIAAISQVSLDKLHKVLDGETVYERYNNSDYRLFVLGQYFSPQQYEFTQEENMLPVLYVDAGSETVGFHIDKILNRVEIVVKSVNDQILNIPGISGATILGDGSVVPVLELLDLSRRIVDMTPTIEVDQPEETRQTAILVVDDSVTMRKVATRLLERHDYLVVSAKDGLEAIEVLQEFTPDLVLLDIEMPRMDGFEFATHLRQTDAFKETPIIMITSRTGNKHKERADKIGVQGYLGKPYREEILIESINELLGEKAND